MVNIKDVKEGNFEKFHNFYNDSIISDIAIITKNLNHLRDVFNSQRVNIKTIIKRFKIEII